MSELTKYIPCLINKYFRVTSPEASDYNCIAWAAGDDQRWWEPDQWGDYHWPPAIPRQWTLMAVIDAFRTLGYEPCSDGKYEKGFSKIAIFVDQYNIPTHAARQLENGKWTSKCGQLEDIEHDLYDLCGQQGYGEVSCFMRKYND
jgi:hypothetical protein